MRTAGGVILLITGLIWILQGLDVAFAPQSFMTANLQWAIWGSLAALSGLALIWWDRRSG